MTTLAPFGTTYAASEMVATSDSLATQAGLAALARGGSAVDAAIAANAVLAVTAPHLCGMGGDLFALVHGDAGRPVALSSAGVAGSGIDADRLRAEGHATMPFRHDIRSVTIPGCVDGWVALHQRFGRLALDDVLSAGTAYAADGFPASPLLVASAAALEPPVPPAGLELARQATRPGDVVCRPGAADALRAIGRGGREAFYEGAFGAGLLELGGGLYTEADLAAPLARWDEPLGVEVWGGRTLWTVPPPSQGYLTLAAAWIAGGLDLPADPNDPRWAHLLVEAVVAASHDRPEALFDGADGHALLAADRLEPRRAAISVDRTGTWTAPARGGGTTYLCTRDRDGMGVSLIQSNASGFGSHLFEPSTGINLHNRGIGFSLVPGHPAAPKGGARPPHTLSPALLTAPDGSLAAVLGTQGGDAQPHILLQVLARLLVAGEHPGRAVAAPRVVLSGEGRGFDTWTAAGGHTAVVEANAPASWSAGLAERGHRVRVEPAFQHGFGHANLIVVDDRGVLAGAADPRARIASCAGR